MNKWVIIIIVAIVILGGGYFAAKAVKHSMTPAAAPVVTHTEAYPSPSVAPTASASPSATSPAAMQEITITGTEFAFAPNTITAKKGQAVTVTFKNNGQYPHNFTATELGVQSKTIQPGEQTTVTFTPTKTGSFTFECTVPGHADRGMKGTITVQ